MQATIQILPDPTRPGQLMIVGRTVVNDFDVVSTKRVHVSETNNWPGWEVGKYARECALDLYHAHHPRKAD